MALIVIIQGTFAGNVLILACCITIVTSFIRMIVILFVIQTSLYLLILLLI